MDLEARKTNLIQEFFVQNFTSMTLEQFNAEIDGALDDSENNRIIKSSELKAKVEKWT